MNYISYILLAVLFVISACSLEVSTSDIVISDKKLTVEEGNEDSEKMTSETEIVEVTMDTFKGSWFKIDYPHGFTVDPTGPTDTFDEYEFIETDEATFTSPDGTIQFFVYSPQWTGKPKNYLKAAPNEKIESDKTTADEIDPSRTSRWLTFADKDGRYLRSVYSRKDESTHLVFGIKYSDQEVYDMYKKNYAKFKKSLVQYAD